MSSNIHSSCDIRTVVKLALVGLLIVMSGLLVGCGNATPETDHFTVGVLNHVSSLNPVFEGFAAGMETLGYVADENITYIYDGPTGGVDGLASAIENLKEHDIDLLLACGTPAAIAGQAAYADTDVPVLFVPVNDPLAAGLVEDLNSPGGSTTGIVPAPTTGKTLEQLAIIMPDLTTIFVPHNPNDESSVKSVEQLTTAAAQLGFELVVQEATDAAGVEALAQNIPEGVDAIFIVRTGLIVTRAGLFIEAANERNLPVASTVVELVDAGAVVAVGTRYTDMGKQAARLADQIHTGIDPAGLPVENSEDFLAVNLATAAGNDLEIPDALLGRADIIVRADTE